MSAREDLSHILSALEGQAVRVSFVGGEMYDLETDRLQPTNRQHARRAVLVGTDSLQSSDVSAPYQPGSRLHQLLAETLAT